MMLNEILTHFKEVKNVGKGFTALCPVPDDHSPSLSIRLSNDGNRVQVHCFAGCRKEKFWKRQG